METYQHSSRFTATGFPFSLLIWVTLFAIAMGFMESAVVIYLREILYPAGFDFPLTPISPRLAVTELFRELATLIMLLGAGVLAGKTSSTRFAWFLYAFGIWDLFFYLFLKLILDWPASFLTWDVLFLIPVTWTGPVLSPVIVSCLMILLALVIVNNTSVNQRYGLRLLDWLVLVTGAVIVFLSFVWDYSSFILQHYKPSDLWSMPDNKALFDLALKYIPAQFPWILFSAGCTVILVSILLIHRSRKH
jgi:hypothetical protein